MDRPAFAQAPKFPDHSSGAAVSQATPMDQMLRDNGIEYNAVKFNWIGNTVTVNNTTAIWHTTGIKSIEDTMQTDVIRDLKKEKKKKKAN